MCEKVTHEGSEHKRQLSSEWQCAVMEREQLCANLLQFKSTLCHS